MSGGVECIVRPLVLFTVPPAVPCKLDRGIAGRQRVGGVVACARVVVVVVVRLCRGITDRSRATSIAHRRPAGKEGSKQLVGDLDLGDERTGRYKPERERERAACARERGHEEGREGEMEGGERETERKTEREDGREFPILT